jgi:hypothetical protein
MIEARIEVIERVADRIMKVGVDLQQTDLLGNGAGDRLLDEAPNERATGEREANGRDVVAGFFLAAKASLLDCVTVPREAEPFPGFSVNLKIMGPSAGIGGIGVVEPKVLGAVSGRQEAMCEDRGRLAMKHSTFDHIAGDAAGRDVARGFPRSILAQDIAGFEFLSDGPELRLDIEQFGVKMCAPLVLV